MAKVTHGGGGGNSDQPPIVSAESRWSLHMPHLRARLTSEQLNDGITKQGYSLQRVPFECQRDAKRIPNPTWEVPIFFETPKVLPDKLLPEKLLRDGAFDNFSWTEREELSASAFA